MSTVPNRSPFHLFAAFLNLWVISLLASTLAVTLMQIDVIYIFYLVNPSWLPLIHSAQNKPPLDVQVEISLWLQGCGSHFVLSCPYVSQNIILLKLRALTLPLASASACTATCRSVTKPHTTVISFLLLSYVLTWRFLFVVVWILTLLWTSYSPYNVFVFSSL